jgi:genome maintenance exonuclease 1
MSLIRSKFIYNPLSRTEGDSGRLYLCPDGKKVASVTTILDRTKSEEKRQALANWKKRVGEQAAQTIVTEAAGRGTSMHKMIERWLAGEDISVPGSNLVHQQAHKMANLVINDLIKPNVDEIWGSEVNLYFPGLYAGTTDCVGVWKGEEAIMDFKQTNKPKKREWIEDYFLQLAAYAQAHNEVYGTKIRKGVVLMCSKDLELQKFVLEGDDFDDHAHKWWDRVEQYYGQR